MAQEQPKADPAGDYMAAARKRLVADGNDVSRVTFVYGHGFVALQTSLHLLGKADLFTIMVHASEPVTPQLMATFIGDATRYAQNHRTGSPLNRGLSVIPILVADLVSPEAKADALRRKPSKVDMRGRGNGGTFRWPALVDAGTGEHLYYGGWFWIGRVGSEWIREKLLLAMGRLPAT